MYEKRIGHQVGYLQELNVSVWELYVYDDTNINCGSIHLYYHSQKPHTIRSYKSVTQTELITVRTH
jgi:hypothetical protein